MEIFRPRLSRFAFPALLFFVITIFVLVFGSPLRGFCENQVIRIALLSADLSALVWLAQAKDYFKGEGLQVELLPFSAGVQACESMISGKSDFATCGEFVAADKIMGGHDLCVISSISRFNTIRLIALKESIRNPEDIRGKRVALVAYSQAHFCLANFLLSHGISDSEVEIVNVEPDLMSQALKNREVSAAVVWEPFASRMVSQLGGDVTSWNAQTNYDLHFILAAHKDTIRNRPEIIAKLLKSLFKAESFIAENNITARDLTEQAIRSATGKVAHTDITWDLNDFGLRLDQALLVEMESGARWINRIKRNGAAIPNLLNFICDGPLRALFPGAVSLIR